MEFRSLVRPMKIWKKYGMAEVIISDTSCLIALSKINKLEILKDLFNSVFITKEVCEEFDDYLPEWILIKEVISIDFQKKLQNKLDVGEASSIALAKEIKDPLLIIDEIKGRTVAESLEIEIIGTLDVLLLAHKKQKITDLKSIINDLVDNGFRVSDNIVKLILEKIETNKP